MTRRKPLRKLAETNASHFRCRSVTICSPARRHSLRMAWQLIFKAPENDSDESTVFEAERPAPLPRKPVSVTLQLDPGTMVVGAAGDDDDDD